MALVRNSGRGAASSRGDAEQVVGRLITEVVAQAGGRGQSVYLDGPPGIGKTHLLAAAIDRVGDAVTVLRASGDQQRRHLAFGLVSQLVGPVPVDVHPAEYVLDGVDELCNNGPVIVWVDDAHNTDAASLTVLRRLVSSARVLPLAVLISARPFPTRERLGLLSEQANTVLHLPPMDVLMVERLAFEQLGRWPGQRLRRALGNANGNPLFVVELLRSLKDDDLVAAKDDDTVDLRPGLLPGQDHLHQVVRGHMAQLDEPTRDVLGALAVCGVAVAVAELADVMFAPAQDLDDPLDRAVTAGLVRRRPDGQVDFAHEVYREVTYADLPDSFRRLTHLRLAQLAEQSGGQHVLVAEHRLRGRDTTEDQTAARDPSVLTALRAAAAQSEQYAPEVAAGLLELAEEVPGGNLDEELLARRVENLFNAGRGILAERLVRERIGGITNPAIASRLQSVLIRHLVTRGEVDGAIALIDRTTGIPGLPEAIHLQLMAVRALAAVLGGLPLSDDQADALASRIAAGDATEAALTFDLAEGCRAFLSGSPGAALPLLREAAQPTGAGAPIGSANVFSAWATMAEYGPPAAVDEVRKFRQLPERDVRWSDPYLGFIAGLASLLTGEWDDAVAELDTALELADDLGSRWLSVPVGSQAYIEAHRGESASARGRLERFRHRRLPLQFGLDYPGAAELAVLEADGDLRGASTLARALWSANRIRPGRGSLDYVGDIMRVAILTIQPRLSAQIVSDLSEDLADARAGRGRAEPSVRLVATTNLVQGMAAADADQLTEAVDAFASQGWTWHRMQALEELACAAAAAGDRPRAGAALDEAITEFDRVGASRDRDRLLSRARALGLRRGSRETPRTADRGWASLTATELRVTALIREGLTNREIGSRLFISPRTVQTHVSHILVKTGLRSRVDVATASAESDQPS